MGNFQARQAGHAPEPVRGLGKGGTTRARSGARAGTLVAFGLGRRRRCGRCKTGSGSWANFASVTSAGTGTRTATATVLSGRGRKPGGSSGGMDAGGRGIGVARADGTEDDGLHRVGPLGPVALLQKGLVPGGEEGVHLVDRRSGDSDRFAGSGGGDDTALTMLMDVDQPVTCILGLGEPGV